MHIDTISNNALNFENQNNNDDIVELTNIFLNDIEQDEMNHMATTIANRNRQCETYLFATKRLNVIPHNLGELNNRCRFCNALFFRAECNTRGEFTLCCQKGKIDLAPLGIYPEILQNLFTGQHPESKHFLKNILQYNHAFQFLSMQVKLREFQSRGPYTFAVQGKILHHLGNIVPNQDPERFKFSSIYFLDPEAAVSQREYLNNNLNVDLLRIITDIMSEINPYARDYYHLREKYLQIMNERRNMGETQHPTLVLELRQFNRNERHFDLPQQNEVAVIYESEDDIIQNNTKYRVFLKDRPERLKEISFLSEIGDPLTFPLLFINGELGWHQEIHHRLENLGNEVRRRRQRVTHCEFYAHRLAVRDNNNFQIFRYAGKLSQQYIVSAYMKIEANRLNFIRLNQNAIRAESYTGLTDYLQGRADTENLRVGKMVVLPSTYIGSPRSQVQCYNDAIAMVVEYGVPSLFITVTSNPKWPEIINNIPRTTESGDHPMLVARVFHSKLKELLNEILNKQIFGVALAQTNVIEFQKRGLPHSHILTILDGQDKLNDPFSIDNLISAEIPNPTTNGRLYELVKKFMVHGPCSEYNPNAPCMINGVCSKHYPKEFSNETVVLENGYISYRRRDLGFYIEYKPNRNAETDYLDNRWIVPYNPYLLLKYEAHINVESCASIKSVKYLYKYLHKEVDHACVSVRQVNNQQTNDNGANNADQQNVLDYDEIESYLSGRYLAPPESAWRILQYELHQNTHTVIRLPIHLPDQQMVYFGPENVNEAIERGRKTMLTEYFTLNRNDLGARQYLYADIPKHYVWYTNNNNKRWQKRQRRHSKTLTRMYNVSLKNRELYYLRMLLLHVRGAQSYENLRTINGIRYDTFLDACKALNLLSDDSEYFKTLREGCLRDMPRQLRHMFAYILAFGELHDPQALWTEFRSFIIEDYIKNGDSDVIAEQKALRSIQRILYVNGTTLSNFNLPEPDENLLIDNEGTVNVENERIEGENLRNSLTETQLNCFNQIMNAVNNDAETDRLFYLNGQAGAGKTFLYNSLISTLRGENKAVISMAFTGIAATLLKGGRTIHTTLKFPVPFKQNSTSQLRPNANESQIIKDAKLVICDEISMVPKDMFVAINKTLQYICENNQLFANKVVLIGGDFKQCLPVVINGSRGSCVAASVKRCHLWHAFKELKLTTNMRAINDQNFVDWLNRLGNGTLPFIHHPLIQDLCEIPNHCIVQSKEELINHCFGDFNDGHVQNKYNRAILTPLNDTCHDLNSLILNRLNGISKTYISADSILIDEENNPGVDPANFPIEYLNSITPTGLPPSKLTLKVGSICMLIRNLCVNKKLCNGTRLVIRRLPDNYIEAERLTETGDLTGEIIFIPRIDLTSDTTVMPFKLKRRQFPIRLAYAITINKSQGQTFEKVAIYLKSSVFTHGQFYVAVSRARTFDSVAIFIENTPQQGKVFPNSNKIYTKNIVYKEIL